MNPMRVNPETLPLPEDVLVALDMLEEHHPALALELITALDEERAAVLAGKPTIDKDLYRHDTMELALLATIVRCLAEFFVGRAPERPDRYLADVLRETEGAIRRMRRQYTHADGVREVLEDIVMNGFDDGQVSLGAADGPPTYNRIDGPITPDAWERYVVVTEEIRVLEETAGFIFEFHDSGARSYEAYATTNALANAWAILETEEAEILLHAAEEDDGDELDEDDA